MRKRVKTAVIVVALIVGVLAIGGVVLSDTIARTDALFFTKPIPYHAYLKARQAVADSLHYIPRSFFQVKVQLLRREPDIHRNQEIKHFFQGQLDQIDARQHPDLAKGITKKIKRAENHHKALIFRVLETLEGPSPGEEIVVSEPHGFFGHWRWLEGKNWYMIGYQEIGGRTHGISLDWRERYERNDGFLTDIK